MASSGGASGTDRAQSRTTSPGEQGDRSLAGRFQSCKQGRCEHALHVEVDLDVEPTVEVDGNLNFDSTVEVDGFEVDPSPAALLESTCKVNGGGNVHVAVELNGGVKDEVEVNGSARLHAGWTR